MARPRQWRGSEAQALARVAGVADPQEAMRLLVDDLLGETEQRSAPVNLVLVASFRGIGAIIKMPMKEAAIITPTPQGLRVFINSSDVPGRQNFSIAHEICHTLFPQFLARPTVKDTQTGTFPSKSEEEWLCDFGASRLLLPPPVLQERALRYGPNIGAVLQLAEDFEASIEATAIAWAALDLWPAAVVFLEERIKPSQTWRQHQMALPTMEEEMRLEPELRVELACLPPSFSVFIPKHKSVGRDGPIYAALATEGGVTGRDVLALRQGELEVDAEAVYAPYRKDGNLQQRVVCLIRRPV